VRIEDEIRAQIGAQLELRNGLDQMGDAVKDYWRSVSPVDDGQYAASVRVFRRYLMVDGMPGVRVGATDFKAHWIEFGTGEPGPTKAVAPRAKTAAHFGGDESEVNAVIADDDLSEANRRAVLARMNTISIDMTG
jgi:hypothetical protein